jgi:nitrilase
MIVDPWGEVLDVRDEGEGVVIADLDPERIAAVRRQLPALEHRRLSREA